MKTALVAGATGLIGSQLLNLLLADDRYQKIKTITRRPLQIDNSKFENLVYNFDAIREDETALQADDVFCCLGTTIRQAKSKEAFRKVDYDYPVTLARTVKHSGTRQYLLVSSLGADKNSLIFYNKVKGEVEEAIRQISFDTLHIFRPSLLFGPRKESRAGEDAAKIFFKLFGFLVPLKFKTIESEKVARAMVHFANTKEKGFFIHESKELQQF